MDSDTKVWRDAAIRTASSMSDAYWSISLVNMDIGVADIDGVSSLEALMVTVSPSVFIPLRTPVIPGQVTET